MEEKEREKPIKYKDMFIDVGAKSREDAEKLGVSVGDFATLERSFTTLREGFITGKAFDNRLGCYAMVEVAKRVKGGFTLFAVGTAQEEVGLKGARTSAYRINPDLAIVIDVTTTGDHPGVKEEESAIKLGNGPAITIVDAKGRGVITHPKVKELLIKTAEKHKIPYQLEVGEGGTTDATAIQLTREGVPTGVVSIPSRYIHTPVGVASMKDVKNCIRLITLALEEGV
jgi:endoglucanase